MTLGIVTVAGWAIAKGPSEDNAPTLNPEKPAVLIDTRQAHSEYNPTTLSSDNYPAQAIFEQCLPDCARFVVTISNEVYVELDDHVGQRVTPADFLPAD